MAVEECRQRGKRPDQQPGHDDRPDQSGRNGERQRAIPLGRSRGQVVVDVVVAKEPRVHDGDPRQQRSQDCQRRCHDHDAEAKDRGQIAEQRHPDIGQLGRASAMSDQPGQPAELGHRESETARQPQHHKGKAGWRDEPREDLFVADHAIWAEHAAKHERRQRGYDQQTCRPDQHRPRSHRPPELGHGPSGIRELPVCDPPQHQCGHYARRLSAPSSASFSVRMVMSSDCGASATKALTSRSRPAVMTSAAPAASRDVAAISRSLP